MNEPLFNRAQRFARAWRERLDSGPKVLPDTFVYLLAVEFQRVAEEARADERQRIAAKLAALVNPS